MTDTITLLVVAVRIAGSPYSDHHKVIGKWVKKYGDVFGFYNGDVPFLVVNDLDFLEYVFVRNFRNFVDRGMMPEVRKSADLFLERMKELANQEVHTYDEYQLLAMDYTARGAFGIDTVFQLEPRHPLLTITKGVLDGVMTGPLHMIAQCTSSLGDLMKPFYLLVASFGEFTLKTLGEETSKMVELRRRDPSDSLELAGHGMASVPANGPWIVFRRLQQNTET
ncbi:hypothetical protein MTO96_012888 [Rhipicephalus appendiculatus]